jgi:alkyl hydroperoxide reductase subunit AhpC
VAFLEIGWHRLMDVGVTDVASADVFTVMVVGLTHQQVFNEPRGDRWLGHVRRVVEMFLADVEARAGTSGRADDLRLRRPQAATPKESSPTETPPKEQTMGVLINQTAPDFEADTTEGRINFHDWIGDSWAVLFSHPKDFTPVCTTELGYMAKLQPEFARRNVKVIGLSVDATTDHTAWADDIEETQGARPNYPIIGDADFAVSKLYGMLPADTSGDAKARTPADNQTVRNVFVIGPDKKIKLILVYPMTTGRNFDEVLRVIDSLQLTATHRVATPVNWKQGEDVIIAGSVSNDEAKEIFGEWKSPKPYIRIVPQPK